MDLILIFAIAVLPLVTQAVQADWLVTRDGIRIETQGAWELKGRQVIFSDARGVLVALRLDEVDLEASRAATAAAQRPAPGESEASSSPRPAPVLVLTDADVRKADPATLEAQAADEVSEGSVETPPATARPRRVVMFSTSWCGYCRQARNLLYGLRVPFVEWDIERSPAARQEFERRFGRGAGVPILDIGGTVVRGYNEPAIRRAVDRLRTPQKQNPRPATPQP